MEHGPPHGLLGYVSGGSGYETISATVSTKPTNSVYLRICCAYQSSETCHSPKYGSWIAEMGQQYGLEEDLVTYAEMK
jgi:hypothetical protein